MRTACLTGNGLSIAVNPGLAVPALTEGMINQLKQLTGDGVQKALRDHAEQISQNPLEDGHKQFEELLGPLERTGRALDAFSSIGSGINYFGDERCLKKTRDLFADFHRIGFATVLDAISGLSAHTEFEHQVLGPFLNELTELNGGPNGLTIGTLNYDGFLHRKCLGAPSDLTDLAAGYAEKLSISLFSEADPVDAIPLRRWDNLPGNGVSLIHLHGYLGWLTDGQTFAKFRLEDLRQRDFWNRLASEDCCWKPAVVLTDSKDAAVRSYPFSLAYDVFFDRLLQADYWVIVGYGRRDQAVNGLFKRAASLRQRWGSIPRVFIVDVAPPGSTAAFAETCKIGLGLPQTPEVSLEGVQRAFASEAWRRFKEGAP